MCSKNKYVKLGQFEQNLHIIAFAVLVKIPNINKTVFLKTCTLQIKIKHLSKMGKTIAVILKLLFGQIN